MDAESYDINLVNGDTETRKKASEDFISFSLLEIIVRPAFLQNLAQILPYILHRWATKKPITVVDVMDSEVGHQRK